MLMNGILVLAALGALGACFGLGSFSSLAFLWQLPLLFAGLWLGLVLLAFLFLVLWCLPISLDQPVEAGHFRCSPGRNQYHPGDGDHPQPAGKRCDGTYSISCGHRRGPV